MSAKLFMLLYTADTAIASSTRGRLTSNPHKTASNPNDLCRRSPSIERWTADLRLSQIDLIAVSYNAHSVTDPERVRGLNDSDRTTVVEPNRPS